MDAKSLFLAQFDDAGKQLSAVFREMDAANWDKKIPSHSMSPRETVAHLTEAYIAGIKDLDGEEHEWGNYEPVSVEPERLLAELSKQRDVLKTAALAGDEEKLPHVLAYSASHDFYHVGQMVSHRLGVDPDWDSYSIYS